MLGLFRGLFQGRVNKAIAAALVSVAAKSISQTGIEVPVEVTDWAVVALVAAIGYVTAYLVPNKE